MMQRRIAKNSGREEIVLPAKTSEPAEQRLAQWGQLQHYLPSQPLSQTGN